MHFGVGKLIEESGECVEALSELQLQRALGRLTQVTGKLIPFPTGDHPDGKGDLSQRLLDEMADVMAAITYVMESNYPYDTTWPAFSDRISAKLDKFREWGLTGIPADPVERHG